jgi:hypothetical protein
VRIDLRIVNAGLNQHTLMLLGAHATFVQTASINYPTTLTRRRSPQEPQDAIMTIPTGTASGASSPCTAGIWT